MLSRLDLRGRSDFVAALPRPRNDDGPVAAVQEIIASVRAGGDAALRDLTERFDGCRIEDVRVPREEVVAALAAADPELVAALRLAADRVREYHEQQAAISEVSVTRDGISVRELVRSVDRAGLYVPGGRATYPSTVLMTAIPAQVAGVSELALCVPPGADGRIAPATLAAAALVGIDEVYRVGGAQAIAALAYGTETIAAVDVIVGPGNIYVGLAKREVAGVVGIDSFAGPSEIVVVADGSVRAEFAAADLLAQAEHGPGGAAILVAWNEDVLDATLAALDAQLAGALRRNQIESALAEGGVAVLVDDATAAIDVVNEIAPEHLELLVKDPDALLERVSNAGAVFCGPWSPAALGDYLAGPNHVLPTARTARFASALRVDTFRKHIHVVDATERGLAAVASQIATIAEAEGLDAHARSVSARGALALSEEARS